nr:hypothetical protein [Tanacetum cinerariifolium]
MLGIDGEGRGSGVEVVEWRENGESGVVESWRETSLGATVLAILNVGEISYFGRLLLLVPQMSTYLSKKVSNRAEEHHPEVSKAWLLLAYDVPRCDEGGGNMPQMPIARANNTPATM